MNEWIAAILLYQTWNPLLDVSNMHTLQTADFSGEIIQVANGGLGASQQGALGSLVWWLATLHIAGGLKLHDHYGAFQPRPFYDSLKEFSIAKTLV